MNFKGSQSHDWLYLESPENSIPNFHNSWIWIFQFPQSLQVKHLPSNHTLLPRHNKQYRICFWHSFHLTPNFSTPVDAPATWELLQIYTSSVSDSRHPLPVTHTDTDPSPFIFQWRRWVLMQSSAHFRRTHTQKLSHVEHTGALWAEQRSD